MVENLDTGQRLPVVWRSRTGLEWETIPAEEVGGLWSPLGTDSRFLALGRHDGRGVVWSSSDGVAWNPVLSPSDPHGLPVFFNDMAEGDLGVVATGRSARVWCTPSSGPALYLTADGSTFYEIAPDAQVAGLNVGGFAVGNDRIVLLSVLEETGNLDVEAGSPSVFVGVPASTITTATDDTSTDSPSPDEAPAPGTEWTCIPYDVEVFPDAEIQSVASIGSEVVAVGRAGGGSPGVAVWRSSDGISWARAPVSGQDAERGEMRDVTAGGPGLVAVGGGGGRDASKPAAWVSTDGQSWSQVPHDEEAFGEQGSMLAAVSGPAGLVGIGWTCEGQEGCGRQAIWTSSDGVAWTRQPSPGYGELWDVTATDTGYVAAGWVGSSRDFEMESSDAVVWTSSDGETWTRAGDAGVFGGRGSQWIGAIAAGSNGLVAVGGDRDDVAVWISQDDGASWSRVPHDKAAFGGVEISPDWEMGLAAGEGGYVAVGMTYDEPILLMSPDGVSWTRVSDDEYTFDDEILWRVAAVGPGFVAVGSGIWVSPPVDFG